MTFGTANKSYLASKRDVFWPLLKIGPSSTVKALWGGEVGPCPWGRRLRLWSWVSCGRRVSGAPTESKISWGSSTEPSAHGRVRPALMVSLVAGGHQTTSAALGSRAYLAILLSCSGQQTGVHRTADQDDLFHTSPGSSGRGACALGLGRAPPLLVVVRVDFVRVGVCYRRVTVEVLVDEVGLNE